MEFIKGYKGYWDETFCDDVISGFETNRAMGIGVRRDDDARRDYQLEMAAPQSYYPIDMKESALSIRFFEGLTKCVEEYIQEFGIAEVLTGLYAKNMLVQRSDADNFDSYSKWHCETYGAEVGDRALTFVMYLDDEAGNNGTEFRYQKHIEKAEKGKIVIFPAGFTHTHRGTMLTSGTKTIITGWVHLTMKT